MQARWFKAGLILLSLGLGCPAVATTIEIPGTDDCSLSQAVKAVSTQQKVAGCEAGSGTDIIKLESGKHYQLRAPLRIGGTTTTNEDGDSVAIVPHLTIELQRDDVFDDSVHENAVIEAAADHRAIFVDARVNLTLKSITLKGGDISGHTGTVMNGPDGGVAYVQGHLALKDGSKITGGIAQNGGGIFLDSVNATPSLVLESALLVNNEAKQNGGAIGTSTITTTTFSNSVDTSGSGAVSVQGKRFYIAANQAVSGGGIYLDGKTSGMELYSGTFFNNSATTGAAIDFAGGDLPGSKRASLLNNLTIVANTGAAALAYSDLCQQADSNDASICSLYAPPGDFELDADDKPTTTWLPDTAKRTDFLFNSALVGNPNGGCAIDLAAASQGTGLDEYLQSTYSVTATHSGCPLDEAGGVSYGQATIAVLASADGKACTASACKPRDFGRAVYHLKGFLPTDSGAAQAGPSLVDRGSPSQQVGFPCTQTDVRDASRDNRCDAGAVELQIATGRADGFSGITSGTPVWLDVVKNDLGDMTIDCTKVSPCVSFPLLPQKGGRVTVVYAASPLADKSDGTQVYKTTQAPATRSAPDSTYNYPLIRYVSGKDKYGYTGRFIYEVDPRAISGAVSSNREVRGNVVPTVEPPSNFKSKDIDDYGIGGIGPWMLLGLLLLGMSRCLAGRRRPARLAVASISPTDGHSHNNADCYLDSEAGGSETRCGPGVVFFSGAGGRWWLGGLALLLLCCSLTAHAATIVVNSTADPNNLNASFNDGKCTLREALERSQDSYPSANTDCGPGANGRDTIKLPAGTITLSHALGIGLGNAVTLLGEGVNKTIIDGAGKYRIDTQSPLILSNLTFQNGLAGSGGNAGTENSGKGGAILAYTSLALKHVRLRNNHADQAGGAIFLNFSASAGAGFGLTITNSYFEQNTSGADGGVIATVGQQQQLTINIANSTFDHNTAAGKGGAIAANLATRSSLFMSNSIMTANTAAKGAYDIDLSAAAEGVSVSLVNNTFFNKSPANTGNFLEIGKAKVTLSNSIVAGVNIGCSTTPPIATSNNTPTAATTTLAGDFYNLYTPTEPASCGDAAATDSSAMQASLADIEKLLGTLVDTNDYSSGNYKVGSYVPPLFRLLDPAQDVSNYPKDADGVIILDRGMPGILVDGLGSAKACRKFDMRGQPRESQVIVPVAGGTTGGSNGSTEEEPATCDLGAFEVQRITALADKVTTLASPRNGGKPLTRREARVDVLGNDVPSDNATIETDKIGFLTRSGIKRLPADGAQLKLADLVAGAYKTVNKAGEPQSWTLAAPTPTGITGTLKWVKAEVGDPACKPGDHCGLLLTFDRAAVNGQYGSDVNNPQPLVCPGKDAPTIDIPYVVYDSLGNTATATLKVTMADVAPQFEQRSITVHAKPDQDVRIPINVTDPDGHITGVAIAKHGDPGFAKIDADKFKEKQETGDADIHPAWGAGVVWNNSLSHPVITYKHANKTQRFDDVFKLEVTDNCEKSATIIVKIDFPNSDGEDSGGGLGWGLLALLGLGLLRRYRKR